MTFTEQYFRGQIIWSSQNPLLLIDRRPAPPHTTRGLEGGLPGGGCSVTDRGPHHLSSRRLGDKRCPNFLSRERGAGGLKSCPLTKKLQLDIKLLIQKEIKGR